MAAAGLYLGSAGMSPAQAADLGGDCCADLEERVAELEATTARKGNRRVSLTISGQIQTSVMAWDAGGQFGQITGQAAVDPSISFTTTNVVGSVTTTKTNVVGSVGGATGFTGPIVFGDGGVVVCTNGSKADKAIGCGDPAHADPPHVHLGHTHNTTTKSVVDDVKTTDKKVVDDVKFDKGSAAKQGRKAGNRRDVYIVDSVPGSAVNFAGTARINPNVTAGYQLNLAIQTGARSHQVSQLDDDGGAPGDSTVGIALANWFIDHKSLGRLTVGRANTATAGITTIDLGGAGVIANANVGWWNAGFFYSNANANTWGDLLGGSTVNGASTSRGNVVNYTSPTFGGLSLQAAWGENDVWDVALRYAGEFSGFRVAAGIGYINNLSGLNEVVADIPANALIDTASQWKGSASILHVQSGLFLTGSYVRQDNEHLGNAAPDTTLWYVQGGMSKNWTGLGNTVLYGEWAQVQDALKSTYSVDVFGTGSFSAPVNLGNAEVWGLGIVQHVDAAAMELYLSYRNYSAEAASTDFDVVVGGARIRF